jgi:hypothetical protein
MSHANGSAHLDNRLDWSEVGTSVREAAARAAETPSQFVQGTMFKLDRMKRHLRVLRQIRTEYPASTPALDQHKGTAIDHVVRSLDRSVIDAIKAGLRDLGEI